MTDVSQFTPISTGGTIRLEKFKVVYTKGVDQPGPFNVIFTTKSTPADESRTQYYSAVATLRNLDDGTEETGDETHPIHSTSDKQYTFHIQPPSLFPGRYQYSGKVKCRGVVSASIEKEFDIL